MDDGKEKLGMAVALSPSMRQAVTLSPRSRAKSLT